MATYLVSFDLQGDGNYERLYTELKELNAVRILDQTWCVNHPDTTPGAIQNRFRKLVHTKDEVAVSEVGAWVLRSTGIQSD